MFMYAINSFNNGGRMEGLCCCLSTQPILPACFKFLMVSDILEEYIRKNYPGFKINSSTCKELKKLDSINAELEKDYQLVVLDYNLNNQFELLEQINHKDKCEILVNACCIPNCPRRAEHYCTIAKQQRIVLQNRKNPTGKKIPVPGWHCEYGDHNSIHTIRDYVTYVSPEAIWEKYVPMGYVNFKIEGRGLGSALVLEFLLYYMIKPEYQIHVREDIYLDNMLDIF